MIFLEKMSDWLNRCAQFICIILMFLLLILMPIGVFYRYILNSSLSWSHEFLALILVWLVFLGATIGNKEKAHFLVEYFILKYVSGKKQPYVSVLVDLLIITFFLIVFFGGLLLLKYSANQHLMTLPGRWAMYYSVIPLTSFIIIIHTIVDILNIKLNRNED